MSSNKRQRIDHETSSNSKSNGNNDDDFEDELNSQRSGGGGGGSSSGQKRKRTSSSKNRNNNYDPDGDDDDSDGNDGGGAVDSDDEEFGRSKMQPWQQQFYREKRLNALRVEESGLMALMIPMDQRLVDTLQPLSNLLVNGKRKTGKTRYILHYLNSLVKRGVRKVVVFNGSEKESHYYGDFGVPPEYVTDVFEEAFLEQIMWLQTKLIAKLHKEYNVTKTEDLPVDVQIKHSVAIVLDDLLQDRAKFERSQAIRTLAFRGRHLLCFLIYASQTPLGAPPEWRGQFDYIISRRCNSKKDMLALYNQYFSCFPDYNTFHATFMYHTAGHKVLVADNCVSHVDVRKQYHWDEAPNLATPESCQGELNYHVWEKIKDACKQRDTPIPGENGYRQGDDDEDIHGNKHSGSMRSKYLKRLENGDEDPEQDNEDDDLISSVSSNPTYTGGESRRRGDSIVSDKGRGGGGGGKRRKVMVDNHHQKSSSRSSSSKHNQKGPKQSLKGSMGPPAPRSKSNKKHGGGNKKSSSTKH